MYVFFNVNLNKLDASELGALLGRVVSLNLKAIINQHRVRKRNTEQRRSNLLEKPMKTL